MSQNLFDFRVYFLLLFLLFILLYFFNKAFLEKIKLYFVTHITIIVFTTTIVFFLYLTIIKYFSWKSGLISGTDFSHFDYTFWNIAKGNGPIISIDDHLYYKNIFGNHFSPIVYILSLPYLIFPSHFIPFLYQSFFLSLTFFISFKFTDDLLNRFKFQNSELCGKKNSNVMSITSIFAFLLSLSLISFQYTLRIFKYEFHQEIIYLVFGLWVLYEIILSVEFREKRLWQLFISIVLYLTIKEDAPLYLCGPFFWAIIRSPWKKKYFWIVGITILLVYFFIIFKQVMPIYAVDPSKNNYIPMWRKYGSNIIEIAKSVILNPHLIIGDIIFKKTLLKIFLPWLFLPLFSWSIFFIIPVLVIALTSTDPQLSDLLLYYSAPLIPFLYFSYLYSFKRLSKHIGKIICIGLFINLVTGIGTLRVSNPNPDLLFVLNEGQNRINNLLKKVNQTEVVFVTGGLLPHIDYDIRLRRIMGLDFYKDTPFKIKAVILAPTLNLYPLKQEDISEIEAELLRKNFILDYESSYFKIYRYFTSTQVE